MQPIEDLNPSSAPAPAPTWSDSIELSPPEPEELPEVEFETGAKGERWFREPTDSTPPSAFGATDTTTRVGAAVVLLAFLAVVAGGLLWVIRRDATPPSASEAADTGATQVAQNEAETAVQAQPSPTAETTAQAEPVEARPASAAAVAATTEQKPSAQVDAKPSNQVAAKPTVQPEPLEARTTPVAEPKPASVVAAHSKPEPKPTAAKANTHHVALSTGAVKSVSFSRAGKDVRATLAIASGSKIDRVFVLKSPNRVVVDVKGSTPHGSTQLKAGVPGVDTVRVGALKNGTRLVFDVPTLAGSVTQKGSTVEFDLH